MDRIDALFEALDDVTIAREVTRKHNDARLNYPKPPDINTYEDFLQVIGDYYKYHYSKCIVIGGEMTSYDAEGEALNILRNDPMILFANAKNGTNGGIRAILDKIAEELINKSSYNYSMSVFSKFVRKDNRADCVEICTQLINKYGHLLGSDIDRDHPEIYADDIENIILNIVHVIAQGGKSYRRVVR